MLVWLLVPFYDFCGFWSIAVNSVYTLQFFTYIFAVLLPDLSRLSCHSVQRMFLKTNTRHQAHKPVKKCNYCARFSKRNSQEGQTASTYQFRGDRSNRRRGRYFEFSMRRRANFCQNRSNRGRDMTIFWFFQDGGRPPSWICYVCVRTTHEGHLMVFIAVPNVVGIDLVVLIICMFFDFTSFASKCLFTPPKLGFWGFLPPKWEQCQPNPKKVWWHDGSNDASLHRLSHHARKSVDASDL